ncbi:MAG: hypothetical protein GXP47_04555, partial [Acidobacteria bacterium]|nr:hypothetical protein [Acidobacteriota bacterium]
MKRLVATLFVLFLAGAGSTGAEEPRLVPEGLVLPRLRRSSHPTDVVEGWEVLRVARAGRRQYLVLLEHRAARWDRWFDARKLGQGGEADAASSAAVRFLTDELVLAIVGERGKVLHQAPLPVRATISGDPRNQWRTVPLVMDATSTCPYALFDAGAGRLL